MNAPARVAAFGLAAMVALGGGVALGAAVGPSPAPAPTHSDHQDSPMSSSTSVAPTDAGHDAQPTGPALPDPSNTASVDDLVVTLDTVPSADGLTAALTVRRAGAVVEPDAYLGARGHLVAIGAADLSYLHVHPNAGDGPVSFTIAEPLPGRYRLFFDFSVDGQVRSVAFTVDIEAPPRASASEHNHGDGQGH